MKGFFVTVFVGVIAIVIFFLAMSWADGGVHPNLPENAVSYPEHVPTKAYEFPNVQGFERVSKYNYNWKCGWSAYPVNGVSRQFITAYEGKLFICQDGIPIVKHCDNGVKKMPDGYHDSCK